MQDFGTKSDDTAGPSGQLSSAEFNNLATELENSVLKSGQALSGSSVVQMAISLFLHSVKSQGFQDSGAVNAYVATPISGSGGVLLPATYTEMAGSEITFRSANTNSGNCTLNIGQTTGTLLGVKQLLTRAGGQIPAGTILSGDTVRAQYDPTLNAGAGAWRVVGGGSDFVTFLPKRTFSASDFIRVPDVPGGLIIQWQKIIHTAGKNIAQTFSFPIAYPSAILAKACLDASSVASRPVIWSHDDASDTLTTFATHWTFGDLSSGTTTRTAYIISVGY